MTRFRSRSAARKSVVAVFRPAARLLKSFALLFLAGCASSSGAPAGAISQQDIAAAYIPLHSGSVLSHAEGAAMVIAPGIAVTNGHNRNLVPPQAVIGEAGDYDLLFFRDMRNAPAAATAEPELGGMVDAYGQGVDGELRAAHGVVREIRTVPGSVAPAYFVFVGDAGPGFSGGPVLDPAGRLIGITFGYKNKGPERLIYAYPIARVRAELSALAEPRK